MRLEQKDLQYSYQWNAETPLCSDKIDLNNGFQVIQFINDFSAKHNLSSRRSLLKIEDLLQYNLCLPSATAKQLAGWVCKNWIVEQLLLLEINMVFI